MRSGPRGRRRVSLPGVGAVAAAAVVLTLAVSACSPDGTAAAPSGPDAQAKTAAVLLHTETDARRALSTSALQPPDDFCTDLTTQYGGTVLSGLVDGTSVTIPNFSAPSTFGFDAKATALKGKQQSKRLYGDAVNAALQLTKVGNKWQFKMSAVEANICSQPDYAATTILALSNIEIGGVTVAHLNKWMTQGNPAPIQTVRWANQCMNGNFATQAKCAQIMQDTAYLYTKFKPLGVRHDSPSWYFELRSGLVVGSVPPVKSVMGSYPGYFLEFAYTTKVGGCFIRLGVNVGRTKLDGGDERPVGFMCDQPQAPAPVASATPTGVKTQPASPPVSHSPKPSPSPSTSTPSTPPSTSPPTTAPPTTAPPTTAPPTTAPPTTAPPTSPPPTGCDCHHTATPTPSPSETCRCHHTPPATPSDTPTATPSESFTSPPATDTPSDTASPSDTPTPQCTCMDTVASVQAKAVQDGFNNIFMYGAYPPPGTKMALAA